MTQGRINHCKLLAIYKQMTDKLDLIDVGNEFCFGSDERFLLSVTFAKSTYVL